VTKARMMVILNPILFVSLLIQILTSLFMFFNLFTSKSEIWFGLHQYNGLVFIFLALLHLMLNWSWVKANFFKKTAKV